MSAISLFSTRRSAGEKGKGDRWGKGGCTESRTRLLLECNGDVAKIPGSLANVVIVPIAKEFDILSEQWSSALGTHLRGLQDGQAGMDRRLSPR